MLHLNEDAVSVFVADPTIADVHVPSPKAVFVLGKKTGTTTLYVLGANNKHALAAHGGRRARHDRRLRNMLAARFPNLNVQVEHGPGLAAADGPGAECVRRRRHRAGRHALSRREGSADQPHDDRPAAAGAVARADHGSGPQHHAATRHQLAGDGQRGRQLLWRHLQRPPDLQPEPAAPERRGRRDVTRSTCRPTMPIRCSAHSRPATWTSARSSTR